LLIAIFWDFVIAFAGLVSRSGQAAEQRSFAAPAAPPTRREKQIPAKENPKINIP